MDVLLSLSGARELDVPVIGSHFGTVEESGAAEALQSLLQNLRSKNPIQNLGIGEWDQRSSVKALTTPKTARARECLR